MDGTFELPNNNKNEGRPKKHMKELGDRALRARIAPYIGYLKSVCQKENVEMDYITTLIAQKHYWTPGESYNYDKGQFFYMINNGKNPFQRSQLSPMHGLYLQEVLQLGKLRFSAMKGFLSPFINIPNTTYIRNLKQSIVPPLENGFNNGIWATLENVVCRITKDTLVYLANPDLVSEIDNDLKILLTGGFDGSGGHSDYRSCRTGSNNLILGGIRLIEIKSESKVIYTEKSLGSDTEFPWFIGKLQH